MNDEITILNFSYEYDDIDFDYIVNELISSFNCADSDNKIDYLIRHLQEYEGYVEHRKDGIYMLINDTHYLSFDFNVCYHELRVGIRDHGFKSPEKLLRCWNSFKEIRDML